MAEVVDQVCHTCATIVLIATSGFMEHHKVLMKCN